MKRLSKGLLYGISGGFFSCIVFILFQNLLRATDAQGFILIGTIILSTIVCGCTGILVETYKCTKGNENS